MVFRSSHTRFFIISLFGILDGEEDYHQFIRSRKGGVHLIHQNYVYRSNLKRQGAQKNIIYWECIYNRNNKCRGRVKSIGDKIFIANSNGKWGN